MEDSTRLATIEALSLELDAYHELFVALWKVGAPTFTDKVKTASIVFSHTGKPIKFLFNRDFWDQLSTYDRKFVLCHEMLHVVLNHGYRSTDLLLSEVANIAADITINHMLVNRFGFIRELITDWESLCWVDTVFTGKAASCTDTNLTMEEYYDKLVSTPDLIAMKLVDEHRFSPNLGGASNEALNGKKAVTEVDAWLQAQGAEFLRDLKSRLGNEVASRATANQVNRGIQAFTMPPCIPKVNWETAIKNKLKGLCGSTTIREWKRTDRRLETFSDLLLPGESEVPKHRHLKYSCIFFIDASGSMWDETDRMVALVKSLPQSKFAAQICSFDCEVYPLDSTMSEIFGGGGTSFEILETYLQNLVAAGNSYPDIVFVLTDGYGDDVFPMFPERWTWLLTCDYDTHVPSKSQKIQLANFV
jgi:predicted metal-dependent peptidase